VLLLLLLLLLLFVCFLFFRSPSEFCLFVCFFLVCLFVCLVAHIVLGNVLLLRNTISIHSDFRFVFCVVGLVWLCCVFVFGAWCVSCLDAFVLWSFSFLYLCVYALGFFVCELLFVVRVL